MSSLEERKSIIERSIKKVDTDSSIREFCDATYDLIMYTVYMDLVPHNELTPMTFSEIEDPEMLELRDKAYYFRLAALDEKTCNNKGESRVLDDLAYTNNRIESNLVFFDKDGKIVSLTHGEKFDSCFIEDDVDVSKPDIGPNELIPKLDKVRVLDMGIGVSTVIQKVRNEIENLGMGAELYGVNLVALPNGVHEDLAEIFVGKFEEMDFAGNQFDLLYSSIGCSSYTPNEKIFIEQLERIVAPGGLVIMNISGTSVKRWMNVFQDLKEFEYEFMYDIEHIEAIMQNERKYVKCANELLDLEKTIDSEDFGELLIADIARMRLDRSKRSMEVLMSGIIDGVILRRKP
jgi:SAM-dependent methyltransferase